MNIDAFCQIIENKTGLFFNEIKKKYLEQIIKERIAKKHISQEEYLKLLTHPLFSEKEIRKLAELITIIETKFFRHPEQFEALERKIVPEILKQTKNLKIWSAGCATGEEPYSIAMVLAKLSRNLKDFSFKIYATDINSSALKKAEKGVYNRKSISNVPKEYWKYFILNEEQAIVKEEIKALVEFSFLNLIKQPFPVYRFTQTDIIFCRNVFIYFRPESIKRVLQHFYLCLKKNGYLILAPTENLEDFTKNFVIVKYKNTFFYKKVPLIEKEPVITIKPSKIKKEEVLPLDKLKEAKRLADAGLYEESMYICKKILKQYPTLPEVYLLLGIVYYEKGEIKNAIKSLKKAIYLESEFALAYFYLGNIYWQLSMIPEAKKAYQNVIKIPENKAYYGILPHFMETISQKDLVRICQEYLRT